MNTVSLSEAQRMCGAFNSGTFALLDVRERWEYTDGHIPHATPLPRGLIESRAAMIIPDRQATILLYSGKSDRAALAAAQLEALGFTDVSLIDGGFEAWKDAGLPSVTGWSVDGKHLGELLIDKYEKLALPPREVAELLRQRRAKVIDIRTAWEHAQGYIPEAENIPAGELFERGEGLRADMERKGLDTIITHCSGRTRGLAGATVLRDMGFERVFALENGCMGWLLAGLPMEFDKTPAYEESNAPQKPWNAAAVSGYPSLSVEDLRRERAAAPQAAYLLDVRMGMEFRQGHIPGSISIPAGQVMLEFENYCAQRGLPVIIVARSAEQAAWVATSLSAVGFPVSILEGGFAAWAAAGLPQETGLPSHELLQGLEARMASGGVPVVAPEALLVADGGTLREDVFVVDVRSLGEWAIDHIPGARSVPRGQLEQVMAGRQQQEGEKKECRLLSAAQIVLVSERGHRAVMAWEVLSRVPMLAERLAVLAGGMTAWRDKALPLGSEDVATTLATHDTVAKVSRKIWTQNLGVNQDAMQEYLDWEEKLVSR